MPHQRAISEAQIKRKDDSQNSPKSPIRTRRASCGVPASQRRGGSFYQPHANTISETTDTKPPSRNLVDLPDGILTQVVSLLDQKDLYSTCLVSQRLNTITDPILYKSLLFNQPRHHVTFSQSLLSRPRRGSLIKDMVVSYPSTELSEFMSITSSENEMSRRLDTFSHAISTMSNLETLVVSVPESLCHGIGSLFNGPFDLACLKSCSLYYQTDDGNYWDLQENIHIFGHPTLEQLTIRHARLDSRGFESLEKPWETGLKELRLIECDINDDALSDLLLLPEALTEFTITQKEVPDPELEEVPDNVDDYIFALNGQAHSLQTITIDFPTIGGDKPLKLREFDNITTLEIRDHQLFGTSRLTSVGLPPNLEVLNFLGPVGEDEEIQELLCYVIENKEVLARKWERMIVKEGENGIPEKVVEACRPFGMFLAVEGEDEVEAEVEVEVEEE